MAGNVWEWCLDDVKEYADLNIGTNEKRSTNIHFTLKKNPLKYEDLQDFMECYHPANISKRKETYNAETNPEGRWRKFSLEEVISRDKTSLDITWIKDKSLTDLDNLPDPDVLAEEIIENLEAGIESFKEIQLAVGLK